MSSTYICILIVITIAVECAESTKSGIFCLFVFNKPKQEAPRLYRCGDSAICEPLDTAEIFANPDYRILRSR